MKIVLTTSPVDGETILNTNPKYVLNDFIKYPPLAILSIVRNIGPEHEVIIYDANEYTYDELLSKIITDKPDLMGISSVTERFYGLIKLVRDIKKNIPGTKVIVGGPHTSIYPDETFTHPEIDYMLTGPCELTFPLFVDCLSRKKGLDMDAIDNLYYRTDDGSVRKTQVNIVKNLDDYPFPDRKRINIRKYVSVSDRNVMTTMNSSRGCPFRCVFCNVPRYYMTGSARRVVEEIEEILSLGFNEIHILDDTFNINHKRVLDICSLIKQKNLKFSWSTRARLNPFDDELAAAMKEAGCFRLNLGVESHNPEILKYIKKGITREDIIKGFEIIHKHDFETLAFFVIGFPGQSLEDARGTMDFIKIIKPTFILMNKLLPLPFSDFYFELIEKGIYKKDHWREFVLNPTPDFMLPAWRADDLDQELMNIRDNIMREFYLSPSFVIKTAYDDLRHMRFKQLGKKVNVGLNMLLGLDKK